MGFSFDDASEVLTLRQAEDSLIKRSMIAIRERYNGDWVLPLTEVEDEPTVDPPIPALIAETIDNTAMRSASTRPQVTVPALDPSNSASVKRADNTRGAYYATWYESKMGLLIRRASRHLVGYGTNVMGVLPCFEGANFSHAKVEIRDPLTAYPDDTAPEEIRLPTNIGFIYPRSPDWIRTYYPEARDYVDNWHSDLWDLFEWVDDENVYIGILGPRHTWGQGYAEARGYTSGAGPYKLRSWPNRAGVVPYVCPGRVTLDRIAGQMTKMVGLVDMMAKLMALEIVAAEKGVFADRYILSKGQDEIVLLSGPDWKDGRTGEINMIKGADAVGELAHNLNPMTFQTIDRMERAIRMSTGQPSIFGGELTGNIRSGQTILQAGAYAVDPRVQEVQEMLEYELSEVNRAINAVLVGYAPGKKFTVFSGWPSERGYVEFTPSKDFDTHHNVVSYAFTGMDVSQISVALAQALQTKLIDRRTAQRKHPLVDNPDQAEKAIVEEALTDSILASFLARAQAGTLAEIDIAACLKNYQQSGDIVKSVISADEAARKRQAEMVEAPPGGGAAPESMPGLSPALTAGAESQQAPGAPAGPDIMGLLAALGSAPQGAPQ